DSSKSMPTWQKSSTGSTSAGSNPCPLPALLLRPPITRLVNRTRRSVGSDFFPGEAREKKAPPPAAPLKLLAGPVPPAVGIIPDSPHWRTCVGYLLLEQSLRKPF